MSLSTDVRLVRRVAAACGTVVLLLGASACGSAAHKANRPTGAGGPQVHQKSGPDNRMPGASGKVAAVADTTAQVQGMDGQVAVSWTGSTRFTKEVDAKLADVEVGDCVFVGSADQTASGSTPARSLRAASVRITPGTSSSCAAGVGGPAGQGGPGTQGAGPGGSGDGPQLGGTPPGGAPSGGSRPRLRAFGGAAGEVTAVSASGFTVASMQPGSGSTTPVVVKVDGSTTYSTTAKGSASDVKVGVCVAANGSTDDTGALAARSIAVSEPHDGQCGGFVRFASSDGSSTKAS